MTDLREGAEGVEGGRATDSGRPHVGALVEFGEDLARSVGLGMVVGVGWWSASKRTRVVGIRRKRERSGEAVEGRRRRYLVLSRRYREIARV